MLRSRRLLTNLLLSCLSGVGALYAVNAIGLATGTSIPVNALSLGVSAAAGVPGVIGLLVGEILLK
jgi:hypothetical protein